MYCFLPLNEDSLLKMTCRGYSLSRTLEHSIDTTVVIDNFMNQSLRHQDVVMKATAVVDDEHSCPSTRPSESYASGASTLSANDCSETV